MKIIISNKNNVILYAATEVVANEDHLVVDAAYVSDLHTGNCTIVEVVSIPEDFTGGKYLYEDKEFVLNPANMPTQSLRPVLVVTTLSMDNEQSEINLEALEVTCPEGTTLTANVEIRDETSGAIIPLTDVFRMPVQARDGREFVALVTFQSGVARFNIPFAASGVWQITEAAINSALPEASQMSFAGFTAYVVVVQMRTR